MTDAALHIAIQQAAECAIIYNLPSHSPSAPQETKRMDVKEQELAGSNDDHDGTDKLSIDRAGMLVFRSLLDMSFTHHCMCLVTWIQMMLLLMICYKHFMLKYALLKTNTMSHEQLKSS